MKRFKPVSYTHLYRYGMFKQKIENGYQVEVPDNWLKYGNPFEIKRDEYAVEVKFGGYVDVEMHNGRDVYKRQAYIYICFANPSCFPSSTGITIVTLFTKCIQLTKPFTKRCKITLLCNRCSVTVYRYKSQVCRFCPVILQSLKFFYIYYVLNIDIILFRQCFVLQTSV